MDNIKNILTGIFSIKKLNDYVSSFVNKQEDTLSLILKILMGYFKYCILIALAIYPVSAFSQPDFCVVRHDIGKIALVRSNYPEFGGSNNADFPFTDCLTGSKVPLGSCLYPRNSLVTYHGFSFAWVGGIVKGDTLVSARAMWPSFELYPNGDGFEFHSHDYPLGHIETRSNLDPSSDEFEGSISEQDFISVSTDTITRGINIIPDYFKSRPHKPLGLEFVNRSYAWSLSHTEDIVMFDWLIRNIGKDFINDVYVGIELIVNVGDLYVADPTEENIRDNDEFGGFLSVVNSPQGCGFLDTVFIVWSADNDGDPVQGNFVERPVLDPNTGDIVASCRHVSALELISAPIDLIAGNTVSYNWWDGHFFPVYNFGPRKKGNFREFHTGGLGVPWGDVNKYYIMQNREIDYDPAYITNIRQYDLNWMYPRQNMAQDISDGTVLTQLLSVGPFDLAPGNELPIVLAFVMGENFHTNPRNLANIYSGDIDAYYANLDFSDLIKNAQWARWIYDNPGIDTDNDGYAGEFRVCVFDSVLDANSNWVATVAETTWYKGDGIPDWRAALPPPAPKMWLTPTFKGINIRFNGQESENTPDIFTKLLDFEGYKIYIARDDRETSYSLLASYDIENYDKYVYNYEKQPQAGWELLDFPMTLEEILCAYADSCNDTLFDVFKYRPSFPFSHPNYPESLFYFVKHEHNVSEFGVTTPITKRFPNAPDPRRLPADSISSDFYTADGYLKFFEYEFIIEDIIPTVAYYVSVTAIDFGWPKSGLEPLETSITENAQQVYAKIVDPAVGADSLQIVVY
ncbi:MAG: hypothetical protein IID63_04775, partial [candidate division Zixibacteria bacterium]|nr:hypothetical protein [candidate division Zixibacteria bacterium]